MAHSTLSAVRTQLICTLRNGGTLKPFLLSATFSTSSTWEDKRSYRLLIVGGGTGGSAIANKFAKNLGQGKVAVVEPSETHYYQPMWTLVGAGLKTVNQSSRQTKDILPPECDWLKDRVAEFHPEQSKITTEKGDEISYEYLVVGLGLNLDYHKIKGLPEAFEADPMLCSNYSVKYVQRTFPALKDFKGGNAIFTFPNAPIKCAGAPQKIMYLAEDYLRKSGKRDKANIIYNTALPVIFGIPRYAEVLSKIVQERGIKVNVRRNLVEVRHEKREAIFENLDSGENETFEYSFMHVAPPCSAPDPVKKSSLVDSTGFVEVDKDNLRHKRYPNVFGIGDCTNLPTAKTAAGVSAQAGVVGKSLRAVMEGKEPSSQYNGYASCPLVTKPGKCIMAEFGYDGKILETFPINQAKERRTMYHMKKDFMPHLYWMMLVKGMWNGPEWIRQMLRLGMAR